MLIDSCMLFLFLQIHAVVAASQVDLNLSDPQNIVTGHVNISTCPITFYGRTYSMLDVSQMKSCLRNILSFPLLLLSDRQTV